jgi:hypothetical protein
MLPLISLVGWLRDGAAAASDEAVAPARPDATALRQGVPCASTLAMVARLEERRRRNDPEANTFLNQERAERFRRRADAAGGQDLDCELGGFVTSDFDPAELWENPGNSNRWITLRLQGVTANRSAIGARVRVEFATPAGQRVLHRTCNTGGSFGSQSLQFEIGLGDATAIERIVIRWPGSGTVQELAGPPLDGCYRIREDATACEPEATKRLRLGGGE